MEGLRAGRTEELDRGLREAFRWGSFFGCLAATIVPDFFIDAETKPYPNRLPSPSWFFVRGAL